MTKRLSKRQKEILDFIQSFISEHDYSPSYEEIGKAFGLKSPATVHQHVAALQDKGYLEKQDNAKRGLKPVSLNEALGLVQAFEVPLVGLITAGEPIEALEDQDMIAVPTELVVNQANTFVLKVQGDSMKDDGILSGDYVIVERNHSPENGDIVVALLDNAYATLKRFYREAKRIRLQPANGKYAPLYVKDVLIQGIVRGVIRNYQVM